MKEKRYDLSLVINTESIRLNLPNCYEEVSRSKESSKLNSREVHILKIASLCLKADQSLCESTRNDIEQKLNQATVEE